MRFKNIVSIFALAGLISACGGGGSQTSPVAVVPPPVPSPPPPPPPTSAPPSVERNINPALTDAAITGNFSAHIAINPDPAVAPRNRLVVMLPGTTAIPNTYREFTRTGQSRGYHSIGLAYPNEDTIVSLCATSTDPDCIGNARLETITGDDTSSVTSVNRANSIVGRLVSLLRFLDTSFPAEGWGQYLSGNQPNWALITVAGHSQGAGHAGYLSKLVNMDRAVMFSGPGEQGIVAGTPVRWLSLPNVTPAARQYGFTHTADPQARFAIVTLSWRTIGMDAFGPLVSVDSISSPFANTRQLQTSAPPNPNPTGPSVAPDHGAPVVDAVTPRSASGEPVFRPVWAYLAYP